MKISLSATRASVRLCIGTPPAAGRPVQLLQGLVLCLEGSHDFGIGYLGEISVEVPNSAEGIGLVQAERFVCFLSHGSAGFRRTYGHSDDELAWPPVPHRTRSSDHSCAGCQAIIDQDGSMSFQGL